MMADLLGRKWRTARRFPAQRAYGTMCVSLVPIRGQTTRETHGRPPLGPDVEGSGRTKHFQGAPRREQFWKIGIGAF